MLRNASIRVPATFVLTLCGWLASASGAQAQVGSVILVSTTADTVAADSACSLREAIMASNTNSIADFTAVGCSGSGVDSIRFALGAGNPVIDIGATPLPTITEQVTIRGNTNGATRVVLNGPAGLTGLHVGPGAANSSLRFLVMQQFLTAVHLQGAGSVLISSYIGTAADGLSAVPNGTGVLIEGDNIRVGGTTGTTPGGACTGDCNLISGNTTAGIKMDDGAVSDNALIQGNFIGTNVLGEAGENMGNGVGISGVAIPTIGDGTAAARNVISGNTGAGIAVLAGIQGNYIGTNSAGMTAVPNLGGGIVSGANGFSIEDNVVSGNAVAGIKLDGAQNQFFTGNFIGTAADGVTALPNSDPGDGTGHGLWFTGTGLNNGAALPGNVIAFNEGDGVRVDGPTIRTPIRYNSIHDSGGLGINNVSGGNLELPPPLVEVVTATSVSGRACNNCVAVDVYSDFADEGGIYEGTAAVANVTGSPWMFNGALTGPNITVTAIDVNGNTSEFTAPVACPDFDNDDLCDGVDDSDADGVVDNDDNCIMAANGPALPDAGGNSQLDTNGDGYGNRCDPDFNNNGIVDSQDGALLRARFGSMTHPDQDLNGNAIVDSQDGAILRASFGQPPGPSGVQ